MSTMNLETTHTRPSERPRPVNFKPEQPQTPNSPNPIHSSLMRYFRNGFVNGEPWQHPVTGEYFDQDLIYKTLNYYKQKNYQNYRALWYLWITNSTTTAIAESLCISTSTLRRRWDAALNTLLLLLLYPELTCEEMSLYDCRW